MAETKDHDCWDGDHRWEWTSYSYAKHLVPAWCVTCQGCGELIFTVVYDGSCLVHSVGVPKHRTVEHAYRVREMLQRAFPKDRVQLVFPKKGG